MRFSSFFCLIFIIFWRFCYLICFESFFLSSAVINFGSLEIVVYFYFLQLHSLYPIWVLKFLELVQSWGYLWVFDISRVVNIFWEESLCKGYFLHCIEQTLFWSFFDMFIVFQSLVSKDFTDSISLFLYPSVFSTFTLKAGTRLKLLLDDSSLLEWIRLMVVPFWMFCYKNVMFCLSILPDSTKSISSTLTAYYEIM